MKFARPLRRYPITASDPREPGEPGTPSATRRTRRAPTGRAGAVIVLFCSVVAMVWGIFVGAAPAASAHTTEQPYLYLNVAPGSIDGHVEFAAADVAAVLNEPEPVGDQALEEFLEANRDRFLAYVADHVRLGDGDDLWPLEFGELAVFRPRAGPLVFAVAYFEVDLSSAGVGSAPPRFEVGFDPFFAEIEGRDGLVLITGGFDDGSYVADKEIVVTYTRDTPVQVVSLDDHETLDNLGSSIRLGIDHIKTGPDHVLFILALVFPSVLWFVDGRWRPVDKFGSALWRVLKIATFFTIAHSITFTLAGMGWLPTPPSKVVEAIIAASIAAAALHNIWPIMPNREWGLSFVFGLFHGMGFASLVSDLGVSRSSQLLSLLGRNIGIEIGQVVVIVLLFPGLFLLRRTPWFRPFLVVGSAALAVLAIMWTVERVGEVELGTDSLVEWAVSLPTGYYLAGAFTVVAGAAYLLAKAGDRLLAVAAAPSQT